MVVESEMERDVVEGRGTKCETSSEELEREKHPAS